ncbi:MAG: 3-keto-5-aminohexanoate cleavage protein [Rhodobacteraceae bacterium]|nr:3-keto-5-aminohexanoate cleavage protein [Paracoccaceae bacterium]
MTRPLIMTAPTGAQLPTDWQASDLIRDDLPHAILVLGRYTTGMRSNLDDLAPFVAPLPPDASWMLCAFAAAEHSCLRQTVRRGGNCRVGFANSFVDRDAIPWPDNAASVATLTAALAMDRSDVSRLSAPYQKAAS